MQVSQSELVMPPRGDRLPTRSVMGVSRDAVKSTNNREPQTDMLRAIAALAALSRGETECIIAQETKREQDRALDELARRRKSGDSASNSSGTSFVQSREPSSMDDDDTTNDYVNGGILAWLASERRKRIAQDGYDASSDNGRQSLHGFSQNGSGRDVIPSHTHNSSSNGNGSSAPGGWQVLADVRSATNSAESSSTAHTASSSSTGSVDETTSSSSNRAIADAKTGAVVQVPEILDASVSAVSWTNLKRVGLANVIPPSSFAPIDIELEERMISVAAAGDPGLLRLYEAFAMYDVFRFIQYARTYVQTPARR